MTDDNPVDAYRNAREVRPGCQHNLGCRCGTPYHLRESTEAERRKEQQLRGLFASASPAIEHKP